MVQAKKIVFILFSLLILAGCANKVYTKEESIFIVFKTPTFKHADLGFIYVNDEEIKVEIYSNGQALMSMEIGKENICMSLLKCMDKRSFNQTVLSQYYPKNILKDIFHGKAIFGGKSLVKMGNGFTQELSKINKYNINYSVLNKQIKFHDTINDIFIKIKRLK